MSTRTVNSEQVNQLKKTTVVESVNLGLVCGAEAELEAEEASNKRHKSTQHVKRK